MRMSLHSIPNTLFSHLVGLFPLATCVTVTLFGQFHMDTLDNLLPAYAHAPCSLAQVPQKVQRRYCLHGLKVE